MVDFVQTYNAYSLAQLYRDRGEHAQAVVEYEQSLKRYALLDDNARALLHSEYGLSQEQIEQELAAARALAQQHPVTER
jgi:ABC-type phosphate transport system ATPase subunit